MKVQTLYLSLANGRLLTALFGLLLCGMLFTACESAEPNIGATISDLEENPSEYMDDVVTVSGEVNQVIGTTAFKMGGGGEVLVVVPQDAQIVGGLAGATPYQEENIVQVTGTVVPYVATEIETEYGVDLVETEVEYEESGPAIIASTLYLTPRPAANLTGYPTAAVSVPVAEVISDRVFLMAVGPATLLPVYLVENRTAQQPVEGQVDINQGQVISLTGTLLPLPSADSLRTQWGLDQAGVDRVDDYTFYFRAQRAVGVPNTAPGPQN